MLRLMAGMLISLSLVGAGYSYIAVKYRALGPGVDLPPQYEDIAAIYKASDDQIICNPRRYNCQIE